jgi:hypothetical protein
VAKLPLSHSSLIYSGGKKIPGMCGADLSDLGEENEHAQYHVEIDLLDANIVKL